MASRDLTAAGKTRFREGGEQRYDDYFSKRAILTERDVDLSRLPPTFLPHLIDTRGWSEALTGHVAPAVEVVREFYSNLYDANSENRTCKVMLRGLTFDFSAEEISKLYELPRVTNPTFPYDSGEEPDKDIIALTLTGNRSRWCTENLSLENLIPEFQILSIIAAANICPNFHIFDISPAWGLFLYALKDGREFDLANHIWDLIYDGARSTSTTTGLLFPSLITRFTEAKGIDLSSEKRSIKGSSISIVTWNLSLFHAAIPSNVHEEGQQTQDEDSGAHPCEEEEGRQAVSTNVQQEEQPPQDEDSGAHPCEEEEGRQSVSTDVQQEEQQPQVEDFGVHPCEEEVERQAVSTNVQQEEQQPQVEDSGAHCCEEEEERRAVSTNVQLEEQQPLDEDSRAHPCEEEEERQTIPTNVQQEEQHDENSCVDHIGEEEERAAPVPASYHSDLVALLGSLGTQMTYLGTQIAGVHHYVQIVDSQVTQRLDYLDARLSAFSAHADRELSYWKDHFSRAERPAPPVPDTGSLDLTARIESIGTQMTSLGTQLAGLHQYVQRMDSRLTQRLVLLEARLATFTSHVDGDLLYQRYR